MSSIDEHCKADNTQSTRRGFLGYVAGAAATALLTGCGLLQPGLKPDEAEFLRNYKAQGRPDLFQGPNKHLREQYIKKGWDPNNITDNQALQFYRNRKDFAIGVKSL